MIRKITPHGFKVDPIEPQEYLLGQAKLATIVLQPDKNWSPFLPVDEYKNKNGLETSACVTFGMINIIEILMKRLFIVEPNYSERYNATLSVTTREGNSIQKVIESIRKDYGVINEELLPFDDTIDTWEKFYAPIPEQLILTGKSWLKEFSLGHEWIFTPDIKNKIDRLKTALQFSPVGVSVLA